MWRFRHTFFVLQTHPVHISPVKLRQKMPKQEEAAGEFILLFHLGMEGHIEELD